MSEPAKLSKVSSKHGIFEQRRNDEGLLAQRRTTYIFSRYRFSWSQISSTRGRGRWRRRLREPRDGNKHVANVLSFSAVRCLLPSKPACQSRALSPPKRFLPSIALPCSPLFSRIFEACLASCRARKEL
jgi:hypothetical protein